MSEENPTFRIYKERFDEQVKSADIPDGMTLQDVYDLIVGIYNYTVPEKSEVWGHPFGLLDYYHMESIGAFLKKLQSEKSDQSRHSEEYEKKANEAHYWWVKAQDYQAERDHLRDALNLLREVQDAITFETDEQAKSSPYGLPVKLAQKIRLFINDDTDDSEGRGGDPHETADD